MKQGRERGIWIIQTLPAVMLGTYTRWFNDWALLAGWAVGTATGTAMAIAAELTPTFPLAIGGYVLRGITGKDIAADRERKGRGQFRRNRRLCLSRLYRVLHRDP